MYEALTKMPGSDTRRWGMVLAGGDGMRLRALTHFIYGDERPKQFCSLLSRDTLLSEARQRAERSIRPGQIFYSLTNSHREYYLRDLADVPSQRIVQPGNRGTAPAILHTLLHISQSAPDALVAVLPSDHYFSSEKSFTASLESAFAVAAARTESVVLLGAQPAAPEAEYGWIDVGEALNESASGLYRVNGFHEKPHVSTAGRLFRNGSLWNTFVMVGHINSFLEMASPSLPGFIELLRSAPIRAAENGENHVPRELYDQIAPVDFSREVLSPGSARLLALSLGALEWNDLGDPARLVSTLLTRGGELPSWVSRWQTMQAGSSYRPPISAAVA